MVQYGSRWLPCFSFATGLALFLSPTVVPFLTVWPPIRPCEPILLRGRPPSSSLVKCGRAECVCELEGLNIHVQEPLLPSGFFLVVTRRAGTRSDRLSFPTPPLSTCSGQFRIATRWSPRMASNACCRACG